MLTGRYKVFKKKLSVGILSFVTLGLVGCETTNPENKMNIKKPMAFLNSNKEVPPPVAHAFQLLKEEKYVEASKFINMALQSQPKSLVFHILNGLTYEKLAERGDAAGVELAAVGYQNAINIDPSNVFAITQLGKINYKASKFDDAQENFANALLVKPNDVNLLQELAAASYYSHDIGTALVAIDKAHQLKPDDALINRSAAIIHAALGDFPKAKQHLAAFEKQAGNDPELNKLTSRYNDWVELYKSGRINLAAATDPTSTPSPAASADSGQKMPSSQPSIGKPKESGAPSAGGDSFAETKAKGAAEITEDGEAKPKYGHGWKFRHPQVIVDCYLLTILEDARTSKGNNIMENLSVTLTPGGITKFRNYMRGTGVNTPQRGAGTSSFTDSAAQGFQSNVNLPAGQAPSSFITPSNVSILSNAGSMAGKVFIGGMTWAGLTYSLNIANAVNLRTQVVSRPTLMTFLNKKTSFFSGDQLVQGLAGQYGGNMLKFNIGLQVDITPTLIEGDDVELDVRVEGSIPTTTTIVLTNGLETSLTQLETHAKMRLGETLLLGGLYVNADISSQDGFPGLQDIPVVQYFFANESTRSLRRSVMLLITPRSPDMIKNAVDRDLARGKVRPNLEELANRHPDWFGAHVNLSPVIHMFSQDPVTYYEFRTGDVLPPSFGWEVPFADKLGELFSFVYF
jgi:tetratricopeptide (TPR) repeat protein